MKYLILSKKTLLLSSILFTSFQCLSQEAGKNDIENVSKITFPDFGFSYELRIAKFQSLVGKVSLSPYVFLALSTMFGNNSSISLNPTLSLQYRKYYNFDKRHKKQKRTDFNNLNYISPIIMSRYSSNSLIFPDGFSSNNTNKRYSYEDFRNTIGFLWGLQRNYQKRFSFDFSAGLGINLNYTRSLDIYNELSNSFDASITPIIKLSVGVWLNDR
ncbi:MAG: hypothetical protein QM539_00240 [Alphaproteobacteria bacterium]|nr:hypothetical protein [Alphaproteobacteria bacterium]